MGLSAFFKHLFRDRDPLDPLGFDPGLDAEPEQIRHPVQLVMLNDDKTPMEFVLKVLENYLDQEKDAAVEAMLRVHTEGECAIGILERKEAEKFISKIELESKKRGYSFITEARPL